MALNVRKPNIFKLIDNGVYRNLKIDTTLCHNNSKICDSFCNKKLLKFVTHFGQYPN